MTVSLRPMTEAEFTAFAAEQFDAYLAARVSAGETASVAREIADAQFAVFPAPGHRVHAVVDGDVRVGALWLGPGPTRREGLEWIYLVEVEEAVRGRGYGKAVMRLAEQDARAHGAVELTLNVFGDNTTAQALYRSTGFEVRSVQMGKKL
ncbi:GNAT family N-acetyltransferase [Umezawaea endophytica]|uniref:GNAT family N-acetyltransferase n=1 Tax=Umezawaea endophytica TaxID=1654476 RepID=A0A9X3A2E9_9PSEU|nr:GNAT family N-acetyltransferase [Umezawaea endophytica]MCS7478978.1 GNAT family N-acetyltransferase [Umezawaea endophytica]